MSLDDDVRDELRTLEAAHRLRVPRVVDGLQGPHTIVDGTLVLNLASNDYLSLAGDRRIARAAASALDEAGTGAGASRLIVGNHRAHALVEDSLADWMRTAAARLFNSGYAANVGVLTSLLGPDDVVFSDALNHASIIDGCRLSRAQVIVYPHLDLAALERALATPSSRSPRRTFVVSESLFSMDGDIADVAALATLAAKHGASLVLDEAHAVGVWGPEGRGIAASVGVVPDILVGTCGKALGSFGAFVATTRAISDLLWNRARPFVFSTGLPPFVAAAIGAAVQIIRGSDGEHRRRALAARARDLRARIPKLGGAAESAIAPLLVGDDREVMQITARLLEQRVYVQGIRPPTVPEGTARLRVSLSAGHTPQDLETLTGALCNAARHFT